MLRSASTLRESLELALGHGLGELRRLELLLFQHQRGRASPPQPLCLPHGGAALGQPGRFRPLTTCWAVLGLLFDSGVDPRGALRSALRDEAPGLPSARHSAAVAGTRCRHQAGWFLLNIPKAVG